MALQLQRDIDGTVSGDQLGLPSSQVQRLVRRDPRGLGWRQAPGRPPQAMAVQGFARVNVMRTYPDPFGASNTAGRPLSRFGALSHTVSVSPSRA